MGSHAKLIKSGAMEAKAEDSNIKILTSRACASMEMSSPLFMTSLV